jgi:hypothetical protein
LSVADADVLAVQHTIPREKRLQPEMENISEKNEEIITHEERKLEIFDKDSAFEGDGDLLFLKSLFSHIVSSTYKKALPDFKT